MLLLLETPQNVRFSTLILEVKEVKGEKPTDYRAFLIIGISLIAVGISLISAVGPAFLGFLACGVVFMAIGLANRDKWAKSKSSMRVRDEVA